MLGYWSTKGPCPVAYENQEVFIQFNTLHGLIYNIIVLFEVLNYELTHLLGFLTILMLFTPSSPLTQRGCCFLMSQC